MGKRQKTIILGEFEDTGETCGIGPVYTDESIDKVREEIAKRGGTVVGEVRLMSFAEFRAST